MNRVKISRWLSLSLAITIVIGCGSSHENQIDEPKNDSLKVVFVAGPDSHKEGAHDHGLGSDLLAKHLQQAMPNVEVVVAKNGWPKNSDVFNGADTVVMYCDGGSGHVMNRCCQLIEFGSG